MKKKAKILGSAHLDEHGHLPTCRICLMNAFEDKSDFSDSDDRLIRPCLCRGTQAFVHVSCLSLWRDTSLEAFVRCSVCHYQYKEKQTFSSTLLRSGLCVPTWWSSFLFPSLQILLLGLIIDQFLQSSLRLVHLSDCEEDVFSPAFDDEMWKVLFLSSPPVIITQSVLYGAWFRVTVLGFVASLCLHNVMYALPLLCFLNDPQERNSLFVVGFICLTRAVFVYVFLTDVQHFLRRTEDRVRRSALTVCTYCGLFQEAQVEELQS